MLDFYDEDILIDCIENALCNCNGVVKRGKKWNFRCNVCGDSKKSQRKKRGWIQKNKKGVWIFKCYNLATKDCYGMSASYWLRKYFPFIYKEYIKKILSKDQKTTSKPPVQKFEEIKKIKNESSKLPFQKITDRDLPLMKKAIQYCEERKIPKDVYMGWHICEKDPKRLFDNRLIIPYYNQNHKIYYFIARTLIGDEPKYRFPVGEKKIYNIFNIDRIKPVLVLEGPIDSLFCENAVAIGSVEMSLEQETQLKDLDCHFLFDSDETGRKKSIEFLREGKKVFLWKKFLKDNRLSEKEKWDINMVYLELKRENKFLIEELKPYFTDNLYHESYLK